MKLPGIGIGWVLSVWSCCELVHSTVEFNTLIERVCHTDWPIQPPLCYTQGHQGSWPIAQSTQDNLHTLIQGKDPSKETQPEQYVAQ